jgi:putative transposase
MGTLETGGLVGKQKAGASVVEGGGPEGATEAAKEAASSEAGGDEREERVRQETGRAQGPCVESYDDFVVMDRTEDGRRLKMMPVVDEYTRECLTIEVERSISAEDVIGTLARLFGQRGAPGFVRSDNGPEFVARALKRWLEVSDVGTFLYIEAGSPWENAYAESFIGRFGDELLKREAFAGLLEAKMLAEEYREHHNHRRPHSALSGLPDSFGVRGVVWVGRRSRCGVHEGATIDNSTLIRAGTNNGDRSFMGSDSFNS